MARSRSSELALRNAVSSRLKPTIDPDLFAQRVSMEIVVNEPSVSTPLLNDLALLIDRMRKGDERALEELYDATVGKLFALAAAILRNSEDAEEIVCSTYAYAWSNSARFDGARANPLG